MIQEKNLKFVIYNDVEGYKQILNDGESYHMKKDDKIFLYRPFGIVTDERFLTFDVPINPGDDLHTNYGLTRGISWEDAEVPLDKAQFGEEFTIEGFDEPLSITCTFYKPEE